MSCRKGENQIFSQLRFPFFFFQNPLFFRIHLNLSQQNDDLELVNHWIIVKFEKVQNAFSKILTIGICDTMSKVREMSFAL